MSDYVTAEDVAELVEYARPMGDGFICSCPLHDDSHASLKVTPGTKATVLWCHAGCDTKEILLALNLAPEMLFYDYDPKGAGSGLFDMHRELREFKREFDPPPPMPETILGLMSEAFSLPQPWHDKGLDAAANVSGAGDPPAEALRYRQATKDTLVFEYFRPWCQAEGHTGAKMMAFVDWGMKRLQTHFRSRYQEVYG